MRHWEILRICLCTKLSIIQQSNAKKNVEKKCVYCQFLHNHFITYCLFFIFINRYIMMCVFETVWNIANSFYTVEMLPFATFFKQVQTHFVYLIFRSVLRYHSAFLWARSSYFPFFSFFFVRYYFGIFHSIEWTLGEMKSTKWE